MKFYEFNTSSDKVSVNYSLSLSLLITERSLSVTKNRSIGRSTGVEFEFYRSGRKNLDRFHLCPEPLSHAAVLHQNMIENRKLMRPGQTNSSEKQNSSGATRTFVILLFAYTSLSYVNFLFLIML